MLKLDGLVMCPYCGYEGRLNEFLRKTNTGIKPKSSKCPDCKKNMRTSTLTADISFKDWGIWLRLCIRLYRNPNHPFRHDVNFDGIKAALTRYGAGVKNEFWEGWKYAATLEGESAKTELERIQSLFRGTNYKQQRLISFKPLNIRTVTKR